MRELERVMKILLVNSSKGMRNAVETSLGNQRYYYIDSDNVSDVQKEIVDNSIAMVIVNWTKSDFDLYSLGHTLKKSRNTKSVYTIAIVSKETKDHVYDLTAAGINDFIEKPFSSLDLSSRVYIAEKRMKVDKNLNTTKRKLLKLSKEDELTGLLNRRSLKDEVVKEMGRAARDQKYVSMIMVVLKNFRDVVNENGAKISEYVLIEFAKRLKYACRPYDKVSRYGISEFLIFLPDTGAVNAINVAARIKSSLLDKPYLVKDSTIAVTTGIGISDLDPKDIALDKTKDDLMINDLILESLIRRAEFAVEKSVKEGDNKIEIYMF